MPLNKETKPICVTHQWWSSIVFYSIINELQFISPDMDYIIPLLFFCKDSFDIK